MSINLPTTQKIADDILAVLEGQLNQDAPANDKAFLKVLSIIMAYMDTLLLKYAAERSKQNLAKTATGDDLKNIGLDIGVIFKSAIAAVLKIEIIAINGTVIPQNTPLVGDANGLRYFSDSEETATGGIATITATCEIDGADGNLNPTETLTLNTIIPNAQNIGTVTASLTDGANDEDQEVYRERVLIAQRAVRGGGNAFDHKIWAEEVEGVFEAYPYSGKPFDPPTISYPGDRTVYIQCDTDIDPDGIPPTSLLETVQLALMKDPTTQTGRPPLGITAEIGLPGQTLFVEPIARELVQIIIYDLATTLGNDTQVKDDIESAVKQYLFNLHPFVDGIDQAQNRQDPLTTPSLSSIVNDILLINAASANEVTFTVAAVPLDYYKILPHKMVKLDDITYVTT
jgi:hypothetical protein